MTARPTITARRSAHPTGLVAGCDEAGRGCLAGPVVAAAVILGPGTRLPGLDDSKKLRASVREELAGMIRDRAVAWAVGEASVEEIGTLNILRASMLAMHRAVDGLRTRPRLLLVDGNRFVPYPGIEHRCEVKGDARFRCIAAASILAKTHRDAIMAVLHEQDPRYHWAVNKGYPTAEHREALRRHGPCTHHRPGFTLLPDQPGLFDQDR